jgi:integrase
MDNTEIVKKPINKDDLFNKKKRFQINYDLLSRDEYFRIKENNRIIKKYIDAKARGNYRSLIYDVNEPESTLSKNLEVLRAVENSLNKSFEALTQDDVDDLQTKLNNDTVYTTCSIINKRKISHDYKLDYVKNLKQFWKFYRMHSRYELGKEIPDITEYLRIRKQKRLNSFIKFISKDEFDRLVESSNSTQMKAFLSVYFETGARVVEILKLRKANCTFSMEQNAWIVRLPNEKGISTSKMAIELSFSNRLFSLWMETRKAFGDDHFVFNYSYQYVAKMFKEKGKRYLGRHLTPKMIRKSTTMYLINSNANEQYIRAHMGWSASSDAITHYINQKAIQKPDALRNKIEKDYYSDAKKENDELKFKQKLQSDQLERLMAEIAEMKKGQVDSFNSNRSSDVVSSKEMLKAVFDEMLKEKEKI